MATNNAINLPVPITSLTGLTGTLQAPTGITSSAGLNLLGFTYTASAVNYISFTNNTTGNTPIIQGTGSDSNVTLALIGKGTGGAKVQGTGTNDSAGSGYVGELIQSVISTGSAVSISNGTAKDLTSISLTAGDWDVYGNINVAYTGNYTGLLVWCSLTSATTPDSSLLNQHSNGSNGSNNIGLPAPFFRVNIASTTTVYVSALAQFSTGSASMSGGIYARRRR